MQMCDEITTIAAQFAGAFLGASRSGSACVVAAWLRRKNSLIVFRFDVFGCGSVLPALAPGVEWDVRLG
jgi:hypothetical protein